MSQYRSENNNKIRHTHTIKVLYGALVCFQEKGFDAGKEVVEKSLTRIEGELKEAKGEIETLKQEVASREDRREQSKLRWEDGKREAARVRKVGVTGGCGK